jgi:hypothetical protein
MAFNDAKMQGKQTTRKMRMIKWEIDKFMKKH